MARTMFEYKDSTKKGSAVEEEFKKAFKHKYPNYIVRYTTKDVNKTKHIDIVCENKEKQWTFDVKAQKLISRNNDEASDVYTWVELKNNFGGPGWAMGEEMFIAFELGDEFIIVEREKLLNMVQRNKRPDLFIYNINLPPYSQYQRAKWGNKDICVLTPIEDILKISIGSIKKV